MEKDPIEPVAVTNEGIVQPEHKPTTAPPDDAPAPVPETGKPALPADKMDGGKTTKPVTDESTVEGENFKSLNSRLTTVPLWEQIDKHTRNIEIDEEGDFYWPEPRAITEQVIEALASKRILFIRSDSEEWLLRAVQRLATVLITGSKFKNLVVRLTCDKELDFGFWIRQHPLPRPVVLFIDSDHYEFLQKFLSQNKQAAVSNLTELKKLNLYLVCEVGDNLSNHELFTNSKSWTRNTYAHWDVPIVKLQLRSAFKQEGPQLYETLAEKGIVSNAGDHRVFSEIVKREYKEPKDVLEHLAAHLTETAVEVHKKRESLVRYMEEDDFIRKLVIFLAAFFDGLYYPDFFLLVSELLQDETAPASTGAIVPQSVLATPAANKLRERWEKNADRYMKDCFVRTTPENGNQRVAFIAPSLAGIMEKYIVDEQYPFFFRVYKQFEGSGLLTKLGLNEKMEASVIRFFALAAKMDTISHNAVWLKNIVYRLWRGYDEHLPVSGDYQEVVAFIKRENIFAGLVFNRIPLIISGLLINSNEEYHSIIKEFFRLLLNEKNAKKMAVIIASHLYKKYRHTQTFSIEDIMGYFRRTLEEGNWQESFFGYDALIDNMTYTELWTETNAWIDNKDMADNSFTKQFAYLYQLDYILETIYRYFRQFKGQDAYELWEGASPGGFPASFGNIINRLLSDISLKSLSVILENKDNQERFTFFVKFFESIESDKIVVAKARLLPPYNTAISLVADVLETWFYMLTWKKELQQPDTPVEDNWKEYARIITSERSNKVIQGLRKFWSAKVGFYSMAIQSIKIDRKAADAVDELYKKQLQKRRASLRLLLLLVHNNLPV